jgi:ankyrin repeat protein
MSVHSSKGGIISGDGNKHGPCPIESSSVYPDESTSQRTNFSDPSNSDDEDSFCYGLQQKILSISPRSEVAKCKRNSKESYATHWKDASGRTCLHYAVQTKELWQIVDSEEKWDELLEHFGDELIAPDVDGRTALSWAAEARNDLAIQRLLDSSGFDKRPDNNHRFHNDRDKANKTPLFYLLRSRNKQRTRNGKCPTNDDEVDAIERSWPVGRLIWGMELDQWENFHSEHLGGIFSLQGSEGSRSFGGPVGPHYFDAEVLNERIEGKTLLSHAVSYQDHEFVHVLLMVNGIDVTKEDADVGEKSPLLLAIDNNDQRMVEILREQVLGGPARNLQTLLESFIKTSDVSPDKRLRRLFKLPDLRTEEELENKDWELEVTTPRDLENALRCYLVLKKLPIVQFLLRNGASPRPLNLTNDDWFSLIDSNPDPEDPERASSPARFVELT